MEGILQKSGGGAASDECTATRAMVLAGWTAITSDSGDEPVEGTMANQGAKTVSLNYGDTYTIPAGFHNGSGKVTANSLASQTSADAEAGHILSGKTAWVNGNKVTGTMAVQSILSFKAALSVAKKITFTWQNPAKGAFSGVIIVYKTGSYPSSITDGTRIYKGAGSNTAANGTSTVTCTMPAENTTYYFRAFSYATKDNAEWVHATSYTASATTGTVLYAFYSSTTWTVPKGVSKIDIFCVGGGSSGNSAPIGRDRGGGGGAGGYTKTVKNVSVTPGTKYAITVGAGGARITAEGNRVGNAGGTSSFGSLCSAAGGAKASAWNVGANGGSDGGSGAASTKDLEHRAGGSGGTNGGNGGQGGNYTTAWAGGRGQGTTTRAFGDSNGTLYAGGGGGSGSGWTALNYGTGGARGQGGSGGGGTSGTFCRGASAGSANTGGGGGAAGYGGSGYGGSDRYTARAGGAGGSGIVLVRIV